MYKLSRTQMIFSAKQFFLFIAFMTLLIVLSYLYIDKSVYLYFSAHAQQYEAIGKTLSLLGESHWYIGLGVFGALFFGVIKKNTLYLWRFLFLLFANLFSGAISLVLKLFFARYRPWKFDNGEGEFGFLIAQNSDFTLLQNIEYQITLLLEGPANYSSFPSGHTTTSVAVFTYLVLLFPRFTPVWIVMTCASLMSRILANDHFVSDIFAGIIVGTIATLFIYSKLKDKLEKNHN